MRGIQEPARPYNPWQLPVVLVLLLFMAAPLMAADLTPSPQACVQQAEADRAAGLITASEKECRVYQCEGDRVSYDAKCRPWSPPQLAGVQQGPDGFPAWRCLMDPTIFATLDCLLSIVDDPDPFGKDGIKKKPVVLDDGSPF